MIEVCVYGKIDGLAVSPTSRLSCPGLYEDLKSFLKDNTNYKQLKHSNLIGTIPFENMETYNLFKLLFVDRLTIIDCEYVTL